MTREPLDSSRRKFHVQEFFLVLITLAAWFPICRRYLRMADDFALSRLFLQGGLNSYYNEFGIWRIVGHGTGIGATLVNPMLSGVLALLTQCAASLFLLAALKQLLVSRVLPLLVSTIYSVYPWGATVLLWASAYSYLLSTAAFLAVVCVLLGVLKSQRKVEVTLCLILPIVSLLANEALFFALLVAGGFVLFRRELSSGIYRFILAGAPAVGSLIWFLMYKTIQGAASPERIKLNPRTLLSGLYYQYTNVWVFEPWSNAKTRDLLFYGWSWWHFVISAIFLICAATLVLHKSSIFPSKATPSRKLDKRLFGFLLLLLVAAVAIYAVGGGYSLDSRKKYSIVCVGLLVFGFAVDRLLLKRDFSPRLYRTSLIAVALAGIATTWLQIGLWRHEAVRLNSLVDLLSRQPDPNSVQVEWASSVQLAWPQAERYWGATSAPWVWLEALRLNKILTPVPTKKTSRPIRVLNYDSGSQAWVALY